MSLASFFVSKLLSQFGTVVVGREVLGGGVSYVCYVH